MKRYIAMLLIVTLLCGLISGCTGSGDVEETTAPDSTAAVTTVPATDATETEAPETTEPEETEPEETVPPTTAPKATEPKPTQPKPTQPKPTQPKPTDPKPTDPEPTDPKPTDPKPTDPKPTDPEPTDPKPTDPTEPETTAPIVYSSFYYFYDYMNIERVQSEVATFQAVTGVKCTHSALDYGFLQVENYDGICEGYNEMYNVYLYQYSKSKVDAYIRYLEDQGFAYVSTENFKQGYSRYYKNPDNGYQIDIFVKIADNGIFEYVAIQPYMNAGT